MHDHIEMAYIISNKAIFIIDDVTYEVKEGDIVIINPNQVHKGMLVSPNNLSDEFFIGFSNFGFEDMKENILFSGEYPIIETKPSSRGKITKLISDIMYENNSNDIGKCCMLKSYLIQFIIIAIREKLGIIEDNIGIKTKVSTEITTYFKEHFSEKISLEQISKNLYLSPFYISKIFKEQIGEPPINYLIKIRLEKAKELLQGQNNLSIKEISATVGYNDAYHFSKLFKKYYGVSPIEYKKNNIM